MKRECFGGRAASLLAACALLWSACASDATSRQDTARPDCSSDASQKLLTYCVSPAAAGFAARNEAVIEAIASGPVSPEMFPLPVGDSPMLGPASAAVTVVVFSDLECPYCAQAHAELEALHAAFPQDVRLVFKHFPLSFHQEAMPAAIASQVALEQGKFWEFVSAAFAQQDTLSRETIPAIMTSIGADATALTSIPTAMAARVQDDIALGEQINISGTPTIFLNGVAIPPGVPADQLARVVVQQKQIAQAFVDSGVPPNEVYWRMVRAQYQPLPERTSRDPPEQEPQAPEEDSQRVSLVPVADSATRGADAQDALVTIVVFSDFECPFCRDSVAPLEQAVASHRDTVRVVFKHLPLPIHPMADEAARAGILAQSEGKFWGYHDRLFAAQGALDEGTIRAALREAGVEASDEAIAQAIAEGSPQDEAVMRDMRLGFELGVRGTPTLFVNGMMIMGIPRAR